MLDFMRSSYYYSCFTYIDTATTEIYTLSLHDALPICAGLPQHQFCKSVSVSFGAENREQNPGPLFFHFNGRSEEHTSELQSHVNLVCRVLLEKKKISNNESEQ